MKDSIAICKMIRGKSVETSIRMLGNVVAKKLVVKMNNREVAHKPGKGIMAGKYPINTAREFIRLLRQLNANALVNEIDVDKRVVFCKADVANRPFKSGGRQAKRANVFLRLDIKETKK